MKRYIGVLLLSFSFIFICSCTFSTQIDSSKPTLEQTRTTFSSTCVSSTPPPIDLAFDSFFDTEQSFSNFSDAQYYFFNGHRLFYFDTEHDCVKEVTDLPFRYIDPLPIHNGYFYFSDQETVGRFHLRSKETEKLWKGDWYHMAVSGDMVYGYDLLAKTYCSQNRNTGEKVVYGTNDVMGSDGIFYSYHDRLYLGNDKLYELSPTEPPKVIADELVFSPIFYANRLFYLTRNGEGCWFIKCMELDSRHTWILEDNLQYDPFDSTANLIVYQNRLYYSDKNGVYSMLLDGTDKRKILNDSLPYMKFIYKDFIFSYTPLNLEDAINQQDIVYEFSSTGPLTTNSAKRVYEFPK